jgi:putative transcriptional regulator
MKNRLRVFRAEHAWSQADLATRLRVSRQTVNAIETGKYDPSLPLAFRIAKLFQQPIESIFQPGLEESDVAGNGLAATVKDQAAS